MMRYIGIFLVMISSVYAQHSTVVTSTFFSDAAGKDIAYQVYLPDNYKKHKDSLAILYVLHGHGGSEKDWMHSEKGRLPFLLDSLITIRKIPPVLAVTINAENSWYIDHELPMEELFIQEFIPIIEERYTSPRTRDKRVIAGNSAGGFGALRLGMKYPSLFHSAILLSPAAYYPQPPLQSSSRRIPAFATEGVFDPQKWDACSYPYLLEAYKKQQLPVRFFLSTGDDDPFDIVEVVISLRTFMKAEKIPQELSIINGRHSWDVWRSCLTRDIQRAFNSPNKF
ncbi:alpha/beta hydrolase [Aquimarina hainanensis]|uniref:Alpha/beta hydrolase n=1 Tax=Aquimarina hainanensis TaxID=1578017 RepID=A0ABW5NDM8_9FLAO|nr:alpha/beta hydrolase-fold protein [Aquimarina sp. TRL1]QKX07410.1 esterase family protein [Aquimarina sp. TRL1]